MDVTQEADVRAMALHLPPANIQNECFSERSHLMFCSYGTHGGITLSKTDGPGIEAAGSSDVRLLERRGRFIRRNVRTASVGCTALFKKFILIIINFLVRQKLLRYNIFTRYYSLYP